MGKRLNRFLAAGHTREAELKKFMDERNERFFRMKYFKVSRVKENPVIAVDGESDGEIVIFVGSTKNQIEKYAIHDKKIYQILFHFGSNKLGYIQVYYADEFNSRKRLVKMYSYFFRGVTWFELNAVDKNKTFA